MKKNEPQTYILSITLFLVAMVLIIASLFVFGLAVDNYGYRGSLSVLLAGVLVLVAGIVCAGTGCYFRLKSKTDIKTRR